ncbi:MAG: hypothetical protein QM820_44085 [Minicystis sp.]
MPLRSPTLPLSCLAAVVLTAGACNLVFGIVPGEGTGGAGGLGGVGGSGTGGGDAGADHEAGTGGTGGSPSCTPNAASCTGAVLHACDANGHPLPDVTCSAVAACDAAARACIDTATLGRISIGEARSCAVEPGGELRCWGQNGGGNGVVLGDDHIFLTTAVKVPGIANARQISVGTGQQCYLADDATVTCWGSSDSGELGNAGAGPGQLVKAMLPAGAHAVEVSTSHRCSCARIADGTVYCWGAEDAGCLGTASSNQVAHPTPTLVPGVTGAVQLRAGSYGSPSCARRADGKVLCWGPTVTPTEVPAIDDAIDVAVGRSVVFIRTKAKGTLWTALTSDEKGFRDPAPYLSDGEITMMTGGDSFCGLRGDGKVICALLGDGLPPPAPTPIPGQPAGTVVEIEAGYARSYAAGLQCLRLQGGSLGSSVYCWGDDLLGALGAGGPDLLRTPQMIPNLPAVATLATGESSTTAVLEDGSVRMWGVSEGLYGQQVSTPKVIGFLGNDNAAVTTNDLAERAYVRKKSGSLVLLTFATPTPGQRLLSTGFSDFLTVRDFSTWDLGLRAGGTLVIHAASDHANDAGIFGDGTTATTSAPQNVTVPGIGDAKAVAAYGDPYGPEPSHLCAIRGASGALSCWGDSYNGEVGDGTEGATVSTPATVAIPNGEAVVSVATGRYFTCAASAAGNVYCWGTNGRGELGDPRAGTSFPLPSPVPGITTAVGVAAGEAHACAWLMDTTVVCWGANDSGQLGDGTLDDHAQATAVTGLSGVAQVTASSSHTCALHTNGAVSCWGSSYNGQVGTGVTGFSPSPLMVQGL